MQILVYRSDSIVDRQPHLNAGRFAFVLVSLFLGALEHFYRFYGRSCTWKHLFDHTMRSTTEMFNPCGFGTMGTFFLGPFITFAAATTMSMVRASLMISLQMLSRKIWHAIFAIWLIIFNNRYSMAHSTVFPWCMGLSLLLEDWQPIEKCYMYK